MGIFVIELFWRGAQVAIPPVTHLVHKMRDETAKNGSENNTNNNNVGVSSDHDVKRTLYMIEGSKLQVDFGRVTIASSTSTSVSSRTRTSSPTRSPSSRSPSSSQKTSTIRCGKQLDLSPVQVCHVRNGGDDPVLLLLLQGRPIRERTQCQFGPLVCGSRERLVQTARRMLSKPEEEGEDGGATLAYSSGRKQHAIKPQDPSNLYSWPFSPDTEVSFPYSKSRFWKLPDGTERFPKNLDSTIEPERRKEANDDPFEEEGQAGG
ncbi:unnamed protein product [Amoebophrya sp. A25]|nr:unnamed protein product [Amoebophrya sp. A25]|eukprot:GSA25T00020413001.1